jgi:ADP-ribose pyrophosphatase
MGLREARLRGVIDLIRDDLVIKSKKRFVRHELELPRNEEEQEARVIPWDFLDTPRSVIVVPVLQPSTLVMVCQYRPTLRDDVLEFPSGGASVSESAEAAAQKELLQETGYVAQTLDRVGRYYVLPSETNRYVDIFVATSITWVQVPQHDDEVEDELDLSVVEVPVDEAFTAALKGERIRVTRNEKKVDMTLAGLETVAALLLARERLLGGSR